MLGALYFFRIAEATVLTTLPFVFGSVAALVLLFLDDALLADKYTEQGLAKRVVLTRSLLFLLVLVPLGIFITTSAGSSVGLGIVLTLITALVLEMSLLVKNRDLFVERFLSQLKNSWTIQQTQLFFVSFVFFWLYLLVQLFIL